MNEPTPDSRHLRWLCRRGMKELDVLLLGYLERSYAGADDARKAAFRALLKQEDPQIWSWVLGVEAAPDSFVELLRELRCPKP